MEIVAEGPEPEPPHEPPPPNPAGTVTPDEVQPTPPVWGTVRLDDGNETRPLHPYELACLEDARKKGLQTSLCPGCDGPRAHSNTGPVVMCYGCGQTRNLATTSQTRMSDHEVLHQVAVAMERL